MYRNTQVADPSHYKGKWEPNNIVAEKIYVRNPCLQSCAHNYSCEHKDNCFTDLIEGKKHTNVTFDIDFRRDKNAFK